MKNLFKSQPLSAFKIAFFLLIAGIITYGRCLSHQFMIDDFSYVKDFTLAQKIPFIEYLTYSSSQHYEPLNSIMEMIFFRLFYVPSQFYLMNIFLITAYSILVYQLILLMSSDHNLAFLTSFLFLIHPMNADLVNHISFNMVFIAGMLNLLSFYFFIRYLEGDRSRQNLLLSYFFFLTALLTQECLSISLPIYFVCYLITIKKFRFFHSVRLIAGHLFFALFHLCIWKITHVSNNLALVSMSNFQISIQTFVAHFCKLFTWYLSNMIWPQNITFMVNFPIEPSETLQWLGIMIIWAALGFIIYKFIRKNPIMRFAYLFFLSGFLFVIPTSTTRYNLGLYIEPYWLFISSMGFFLLVAGGLLKLKKHILLFLYQTFIATICILLFLGTQQKNSIASTELSYAAYWLKTSPENFIPLQIIGSLYTYHITKPIPADLEPQMEKLLHFSQKIHKDQWALDLVEKMKTSTSSTTKQFKYGCQQTALLYRSNRTDPADEFIKANLTSDTPAHYYLVMSEVFAEYGLPKKALKIIDQCLNKFPSEKETYLLKGVILANQNKIHESLDVWTKGQRLYPNDNRFTNNIIKANQLLNQSLTN